MRLQRMVRLLIIGILGTVLIVIPVAPAQAHETFLIYGQSFAYVGPGHTRIVWCDGPDDSSAVRAWYYTTNNKWHTTSQAWFTCAEWPTDHQIISYCLEVITVALVCRQS